MKAPVFGGFGAPSASAGEASKDTIKEEGNTGEEAPSLFPPAVHDEEGEGEEDEETMHSTKAKVFKMGKKKDENGIEKSSWLDLGVGVLRLKKHKEDNRRRMLLRNSSTGKIVIVSNMLSYTQPTKH
jgi:nucleoporin NUP2